MAGNIMLVKAGLQIVHRDLKPGNIMLVKAGPGRSGQSDVKLLDFGLARKVNPPGAATAADSVRTHGLVVGTVPYMAPEQIAGRPADARTDLFALGAVLYEMLTGRRAFDSDSQAGVIAEVLEREPVPITDAQPLTPPALDRLIRKCLAKDPQERYGTLEKFAEDLEAILALHDRTTEGLAQYRADISTLLAGSNYFDLRFDDIALRPFPRVIRTQAQHVERRSRVTVSHRVSGVVVRGGHEDTDFRLPRLARFGELERADQHDAVVGGVLVDQVVGAVRIRRPESEAEGVVFGGGAGGRRGRLGQVIHPLRRQGGVATEPFFTHILVARDFRAVVQAIVAAARSQRAVIVMMGGHVVKTGLSPLLIALMERGIITHLGMNGSAAIQDYEIGRFGATSEDVAAGLRDCTFGMGEETGRGMQPVRALHRAQRTHLHGDAGARL